MILMMNQTIIILREWEANMRTITEKHTFDKFYYTEVSNGEKTITVWPGPNYMENLEEAKKICKGEIIDYKQEIQDLITPLYYKAKERNENLRFFEAMKFFCENAAALVEIGHQRMRAANHGN
jgi:hypothetical protein